MRTLVALNTWCGLRAIQGIRYYEISPSHLHHISVTAAVTKKACTSVLCSSALTRCSLLHVGTTSQRVLLHLSLCLSAGDPHLYPLDADPPPTWSPMPHQWQLLPISSFGTGGLRRLDSVPAWPAISTLCIMSFPE